MGRIIERMNLSDYDLGMEEVKLQEDELLAKRKQNGFLFPKMRALGKFKHRSEIEPFKDEIELEENEIILV